MSARFHILTVVFLVTVTFGLPSAVRAQTTWYVDDDAPGDPGPGDPTISDPLEDGSADHPFDAIQEGIDAAVDGDTVLVLDGTYTGEGNRNLDFAGRLITVRSENGPDTCIIDCEKDGGGFVFETAETADAIVEGFTLTNGYEAIRCFRSSPTIVNCTMVGNDLGVSAAIACCPRIIGCTIRDNDGGVFGEGADVVVTDCVIVNNERRGMAVSGVATITNCTIAENGGGVYFDNESTIASCTITGNHAAEHGGGLYLNGPSTVANSAVTGNSAAWGGGLYSRSAVTITNCAISDNTADWGSGAWFDGSGPAVLTGCTISGNTSGGGIAYMGDADLVLASCRISGNTTTLCAGGVYYLGGGSLTVRNCAITGNVSTSHGPFLGVGGIDCQGEGTFASSKIAGNIGSGVGGIHCTNSCVVNCEITANEGYSGGGLVCYYGGAIVNCSITGNTAVEDGGGVLLIRGNPSIANSILWANSAPQGPEISVGGGYSFPTILCVSHSDVQGGQHAVHVYEGSTLVWGEGNIDADPLFVDPDGPDDDPNTFEDNDYRLSAGSPCIDAADNTAVPPDTLDLDGDGDTEEPIPLDLGGNPRFVDDPNTDDTGNGTPPIVDMGAYEFQAGVVGHLDIKPGSCPNPLNRRSYGVLPVAIVGTVDFDVTQIDVETLVLTRADGVGGSVTPLMGPPGLGIRVEDVATPFEGEPCECHELGGDGIDDLSMKFDTEIVVAELELNDLPGGALVELVVSGELSGGTPFTASDCISLVPPGSASGPDGSAAGDDARNGVPARRQAMPPQERSADGSSQQRTEGRRACSFRHSGVRRRRARRGVARRIQRAALAVRSSFAGTTAHNAGRDVSAALPAALSAVATSNCQTSPPR